VELDRPTRCTRDDAVVAEAVVKAVAEKVVVAKAVVGAVEIEE